MKTISIDFDGTLHPYTDGWCGSAPSDEPPIEGAFKALATLYERGFEIVISSCRADHPEGRDGIWGWLHKHGLDYYVANVVSEKPKAAAYIDDRSVPFAPRLHGSTDAAWRVATQNAITLAEYEGHGSAQ
jgi:hypothetical protein